jgi:hypothetical protein
MEVADIEFVTDSVAIAVTRSHSDQNPTDGEIWRTTDKGISWSKAQSPSGFSNGNTVKSLRQAGDTLVLVGTGIKAGDGKIWMSSDLGLSWSVLNDAFYYNGDSSSASLPVYDIEFDTDSPDSFFVAGGLEDQIFLAYTKNGGFTYHYQEVASGLTSGIKDLVQLPDYDDQIFYAASNKVYAHNINADTSVLVYSGLPGEMINTLSKGSFIIGTYTGFYSIDLEPFDDILVNGNGYRTSSGNNGINNIIVFPNPSGKELILELNTTNREKCNINLYTHAGQLVRQTTQVLNEGKNRISLDLKSLDPGSYLVSIQMGGKQVTSRIVVSE